MKSVLMSYCLLVSTALARGYKDKHLEDFVPPVEKLIEKVE